jgi:hypothetical protein
MRISHRYKFVFLSNPRCGSTSIRRMLDPYTDISSGYEYPYHHHTDAARLRSHFEEQGWDWDSYTVFTTIRNPWDRVVSTWHYGARNPESVWNKRREEAGDLGRFVAQIPRGLSIDGRANDDEGRRLVDRILRLEDIDTTLLPFLEQLGLPVEEISHVNATRHTDYRRYHTRRTRETVADIFASDIAEGGYTFDGDAPV